MAHLLTMIIQDCTPNAYVKEWKQVLIGTSCDSDTSPTNLDLNRPITNVSTKFEDCILIASQDRSVTLTCDQSDRCEGHRLFLNICTQYYMNTKSRNTFSVEMNYPDCTEDISSCTVACHCPRTNNHHKYDADTAPTPCVAWVPGKHSIQIY